jgi:hypothetical protein
MTRKLFEAVFQLRFKPIKAARLGGHFVSERAAKWAPMAGGYNVTSANKRTTTLPTAT